MKRLVFLLLLTFSFSMAIAQKKYWVMFKDKNIENYSYSEYLSPQTIENRKIANVPLYQYSDIPLNAAYLDSLKVKHIDINAKSRWFNSVSATLTSEQLEEVKNMSFVADVAPVDMRIIITSDRDFKATNFSNTMKQMNANVFGDNNITGNGVNIGVIDAGFYRAYMDKSLYHVVNGEKVLGQRDFVDPERKDLINQAATDSDYHGAMVLRMISGFDEKDKTMSGLAVKSSFYLARTENGAREYRGEEDHWIEAIEWMDSIGVRLVNTSLGYAINMDDPSENYKFEDMNGETTRISRAAQIAAEEKGIFLVVSAGNEGNNIAWGIISAPADAQGVLSVGATRDKVWDKIGYSSIGPEYLSYLKPNVSCFSPNGTSFSAPAVTGFVACLMEKAPQLSSKELKEIVEKSAHLYPFGNNYIGYGVPLADRALKLIDNPNYNFNTVTEKHVKDNSFVVKNKKKKLKEAVVFHKKDAVNVVKQEQLKIDKKGKGKKNKPGKLDEKSLEKELKKQEREDKKVKKVSIAKPEGVTRSTVYLDGKVIEIYWE